MWSLIWKEQSEMYPQKELQIEFSPQAFEILHYPTSIHLTFYVPYGAVQFQASQS
jgi:hypothetical protein